MMKRKLCIIVMFSFLLTGCQSTQLTKTESGQISEYIAYRLLKYNNSPQLLDTEEEKITEEAVVSEKPVQTTEVPGGKDTAAQTQATKNPLPAESQETLTKEGAAGDLFGDNNLKISVKNSGLYHSYPKNNSSTYFSLTASSDKKLLVLELTVKNEGNKEVLFKTSGSGLEYALEGVSQKALVTILENDIHFFKKSLKSGKSLTGLVIFEVDKSFNTDNLQLVVSKDGNSVKLPVK